MAPVAIMFLTLIMKSNLYFCFFRSAYAKFAESFVETLIKVFMVLQFSLPSGTDGNVNKEVSLKNYLKLSQDNQ